jgi:hypothetical protein
MTDEVRIRETTMGWLGDVQVGVANVLEEQGGTTVLLWPDAPDAERMRVGAGDVVSIGGGAWEVVEVVAGGDRARGAVTLRRV